MVPSVEDKLEKEIPVRGPGKVRYFQWHHQGAASFLAFMQIAGAEVTKWLAHQFCNETHQGINAP
jgi:hypothetical protein